MCAFVFISICKQSLTFLEVCTPPPPPTFRLSLANMYFMIAACTPHCSLCDSEPAVVATPTDLQCKDAGPTSYCVPNGATARGKGPLGTCIDCTANVR